MKNFILLFALLFVSNYAYAQQTIELFNGKDLSGWTIHGTEKWYVDDGVLVCESGPDKEYGYLVTKENYKNFELSLDFKQEANGNSGVFIRSGIEGIKISGWQIEVAPPGNHTGGIYESYGRGWLIKPAAEKEKIIKPDAWNHLKIKVVDDQVVSWLNGEQMVELQDEKIGEANGSIALQIHSATEGNEVKVRWKNIQLKKVE